MQWGWQPQQSSIQGVRLVGGIDEARSAMVPYGMRVLFMDANDDVFYIKETDPSGSQQVSAYRFERIEPERREYVTREEFEELKRAYEAVVRGAAGARADEQRPERRSNDAAAGPHPIDQPAAGQGAGAAPHQGTRDNAAGMGFDGGSGIRDMPSIGY